MKLALVSSFLCLSFGCGSKPPIRHAGFLTDYSHLKTVDENRMRYLSPKLSQYATYIIDPVQMMVPHGKLTPEERADVARYFRTKFVELLQSRGHQIVDQAGVGTARVRIAMTDIAESTWWLKLHPAVRASGAGTGGASCEGELVDSVTGEQLAAWIVTASGTQFDFTAFSTVDDVKNAIDHWIRSAGERLKEVKGKKES